MSYVDFTTFTETDPGSKLTVTSTKVDVANIRASDVSYVYKDYGVNYFSGDFEHLMEVYIGSATTDGINNVGWCMANAVNTRTALDAASSSYIQMRMYDEATNDARLTAAELDGSSGYQDVAPGLSQNTVYYIKIKRDESVGTYGTFYVYIYSDAGRTTLVDTVSVALHSSKKDYRYLYSYMNDGRNIEYYYTGYQQNLDLQEPAASTFIPRISFIM